MITTESTSNTTTDSRMSLERAAAALERLNGELSPAIEAAYGAAGNADIFEFLPRESQRVTTAAMDAIGELAGADPDRIEKAHKIMAIIDFLEVYHVHMAWLEGRRVGCTQTYQMLAAGRPLSVAR